MIVKRQASDNYIWTQHSRYKMRQYRLTESRVKRVIRYPQRMEEGIIPGAIAVMSPSDGKHYSEIWVMYVLVKSKAKGQKSKVKVVTAWRYPGKAPERDPVPQSILREIKALL